MIALAIHVVKEGEPLAEEDILQHTTITCSGKKGIMTTEELASLNASITEALKHIKPYNGPSRIWFAFQDSLMEGCHRLYAIVSDLPVSPHTTKLLAQLALRLDRKLQHGVDDSNGIVGTCIEEIVAVLQKFAKIDPECIEVFSMLLRQSTVFDWEAPLIRMFDER